MGNLGSLKPFFSYNSGYLYQDKMGPSKSTLIALLFLTHWSAGFKTRECEHEKTVDTIKNIYQCFQEFQRDFLKSFNLDDVSEGNENIFLKIDQADKHQQSSTFIFNNN